MPFLKEFITRNQYQSNAEYNEEDNNFFEKLDKKFESIFNRFEKKLGFKQRYYSRLIFTDINKNTKVTPRDMGLGISQILPLLISTFNSKDTTLYFEQPELHLHPALQMELVDDFVKSYHENNNNFVIETHSEHLILRLRRRIRQYTEDELPEEFKSVKASDISIVYLEPSENGVKAKRIHIDEDGEFRDRWPQGFFVERREELL